MNLPSEPEWDDGLPRLRTLDDGAGNDLRIGVSVPGGAIVARFADEPMAREFVGWLGRAYADRAELTMRALDEFVDVDRRFVEYGKVLDQEREERVARLRAARLLAAEEPKLRARV